MASLIGAARSVANDLQIVWSGLLTRTCVAVALLLAQLDCRERRNRKDQNDGEGG